MIDEIAVTVGGALAIALLAYYFFGPKKASQAELRGGVQEVRVTVKGGYSPDLIRVQQGVPVRLTFDRQETGECTSRVVFPDFRINQSLPAYRQTTVEFTPSQAGQFGFACGMNMVHGTIVVEEAVETASGTSALEPGVVVPDQPSGHTGHGEVAVEVQSGQLAGALAQTELALIGANCPTCVTNIEAFVENCLVSPSLM